ncbi:MAG: Ig-like domain-containing protein, partial [Prevotellaceae bacterium]|nr:Ig-like domain-containing protein [Prevotellaceae bacterium]
MNQVKISPFFIPFILIFIICACANRGQGPTGGKKDETPPRVLKETPANGSVNNERKKVQIVFDENISLEKAADNVIISPPQKRPPQIAGYGKTLSVTFEEELMPNTTYSINFGNAIVDLNEKNVLKNYVFAFSTGTEIDTLRISGTVINAEDLNPVSGILVGIYSETQDSVFTKKPFLRIGRTDEKGYFQIDNIKEGTYQIFALGDLNRDYYFQPGEGLAFTDSLVTPAFRIEEMRDTIWKDSVTVDSVRTYMGSRFLPDDILFRYFKEAKKRQYFVKSERREAHYFSLFFGTKADSLPKLQPLNFEWEGKYIIEKNNTLDSLTYWTTDSLVWQKDTLTMAMTYFKSDSIYQLVETTDTINVIMRRPRTAARGNRQEKTPALSISNNISGVFEIYNPVLLRVNEPVEEVDMSKIVLSQKIDTVLKELPLKWRQTDSTKMRFAIDYKWEAEKNYELNIDSAAFRSIYGKVNDKYNGKFKIRSLEEYSALKIVLSPFE